MDRLILWRHEKSDANLEKVLSFYDTQVSREWKERSVRIAKMLQAQFDDMVLVTNGQPRCIDLYDVFGQYNDFHAGVINTQFDERDFGNFRGKTKKETIESLSLSHPELYSILGDDFSGWMDQEIVDHDGNPLFESNKKMRERIIDGLISVMDQFPNKNIMIITSTGVLRNLQGALLSKNTKEYDIFLTNNIGQNKIPNLSYTEFVRNEENIKYQLKYFNHLYNDPLEGL